MSTIGSFLVALALAGGAPLADPLPWDGVTTRVLRDEASGLLVPVPLTGVLVTARHAQKAVPGKQLRHVFSVSSHDGEVLELGVFENPKRLSLEDFVAASLPHWRVSEHTELPWTVTAAKVPALLFEQPRTGQQYASRAAVFVLGARVIVVSCRNAEDRFAVAAFEAVLAGLAEVRR